jgi:hypothetical protein
VREEKSRELKVKSRDNAIFLGVLFGILVCFVYMAAQPRPGRLPPHVTNSKWATAAAAARFCIIEKNDARHCDCGL